MLVRIFFTILEFCHTDLITYEFYIKKYRELIIIFITLLYDLIHSSNVAAFTSFFGVTFPFFGDLLEFFGGFGFAPTSYFLPSIIWLKLEKPRRFSLSWFINWACIFIGVFIMIASTVGGLRKIVADASSYKFYT